MEWSKIKNIILVMLLTLNLILLGVVGYQENRSARYNAQTLELAVELLSDSGITLEADLPREASLPVLQLESIPVDSQTQREQMTVLLGELDQVDESGGTRIFYRGERGSGELTSDGHFSLTLKAGAVPAEEDRTAQGTALLEELGVQVTPAGESRQDDLELTAFWQTWNGTPVFTCKSVMACQGDGVVSLSGRRLSGNTTVVNSQSLIAIPTVLVRFLNGMSQNGYVCSKITGISLGYSTAVSANRLTPVWALDTDAGRYYVNAITGAFSRAEEE